MGTYITSSPVEVLPSMGKEHQEHKKQTKALPKVLLVGPLDNLAFFKPKQPQKYKLSKIWDTSVPLQEFMTKNQYEASMFEALICWRTPVNANVLQLLPCLKLVITSSTGTNHIDLRECHRRGIQVANLGNMSADDVADMAVALFIGVLTKISAADSFVRTRMRSCTGDFPRLNYKLGGKRVGIVGLGSIGMGVAKRLEAFGCIISYHSRNKKPLVSYLFCSNMVELAATSDAIVLCCALNKQTRHMINREVLLALGKKGVIVNIGRGALIDEEELVKCLVEGQIGGAGLDVFENEPNVPQELFKMDNVILSPHCAASTIENRVALVDLVSKNLEALFTNKPLITPVRVDI
ncbi:Glyoxylate/hydroxypyruvate reductase HPR3, partial [Mucuna pruriens]